MVVRVLRRCRSSLTKVRYGGAVTVVPKRLLRLLDLPDNEAYKILWTLWNDKTVSVKFLLKLTD
jgi:hypothetical protein